MVMDKKQIYIVNDDESVCRALKFLLISFGFEVSTFSSAEKFFSTVQNSILGCLILDIHMPGMGGWHVLKRIIESGSEGPVIIITADKTGWLEEDALEAGAAGFLRKPFKDQALVDLINQVF